MGPYRSWGVVFADIGTSIYYVPGILYAQVGTHAALFVAMTLVAFILLTMKYGEVTVRYPEGGGVVTVGKRPIHPFAGVVGGVFILVDYFLTAAISALSGVIYLSVVAPSIGPSVVVVSILALVALGVLNWVGISESATVSAFIATIAFISQMAVLLAVLVHIGVAKLLATFPLILAGQPIGPLGLLTGFAGAFLAFSGLESISQLAPAIATPRHRTTHRALLLVVSTMALTSPLLTLWSTTLLRAQKVDPNQFISLLGGFAAGPWLQIEVAVSAALLLVFASNTAIIGSYHVFLALARMRFFPTMLEQRNRLRGTPHWAIFAATGIPILILLKAQGDVNFLGDLYAFGLLGAFSVTCISLDIVRWRERRWGNHKSASDAEAIAEEEDQPRPVSPFVFGLGVLTTVLVIAAWCTNLVAKPLATEFGGTVSVIGLVIAVITHTVQRRQGKALVFPIALGARRLIIPIGGAAVAQQRGSVLVLLPPPDGPLAAVLRSLEQSANGRSVVFLYHGSPTTRSTGRLFEVVDPYLEDRAAQVAFSRAEVVARRLRLPRQFVYVPHQIGATGVRQVWRSVQPGEVILATEQAADLSGLRYLKPQASA
ncbi:MAG: APC family permease [Chloroflexi bacterium]|nr:APC family permease [Chloroflexota bacterium]